MTTPNQPVVDFLATRRSRPAKLLHAPYPSRDQLADLLTLAARSPDHGALEPWRFVVVQGTAPARLADLARARGQATGIAPEKIDKFCTLLAQAGLVVAVVASPKASDKIPPIEQVYSAGAVCLSLVNGALASGWGANWITGWASFDPEFVQQGLGLTADESIAGLIFLGSCDTTPPDRPRPDIAALTIWVDA